jgi:hypothetical protein
MKIESRASDGHFEVVITIQTLSIKAHSEVSGLPAYNESIKDMLDTSATNIVEHATAWLGFFKK